MKPMPRYIDADEFRKRIDHYPPDIRDTAKKELRYTPTADVVERKKGKWDTFFSDRYKVHEIGVECSCCGYRTQERTTYCPNCGAEMTKGEDDV